MKTIYISGPMSGYDDMNFPAFFSAEEKLKKIGFDTINPASIGKNSDWTWEDYMRRDIKSMMDADIIVTLSGWEGSKGAAIEVKIAKSLGIPVYSLREVIDSNTKQIKENEREPEFFRFYVSPMPDWFMDKVSANEVVLYNCDYGRYGTDKAYCHIETPIGTMEAYSGDFIVKGVDGGVFPVSNQEMII